MASNTTTTRRRAVRTTRRSRAVKARPNSRPVFPLTFLAATLLLGWLAIEWMRLPDPSVLRAKNPASTALIDQRAEEARAEGRKPKVRRRWVPLDRIAPTAVAAVLVSEDDAFFQHQGVDTKQVKVVLEEAWKRGALTRGASTLTQQLAKNLYLSTDRSLTRKLKELVLAGRLEETLGKERILELYLNVVEWGEGVYGIEAAAQEHFAKSAAELTPGESAILAAMLPAPRKWLPSQRPAILHERALRIIDRLEKYGRLKPTAAASARMKIDDRVGPERELVQAPSVEEAAPKPEPASDGVLSAVTGPITFPTQ